MGLRNLGRWFAGLMVSLLLLANFAQAAPFIVPQGGTGRATFTTNAIIKGSGTGPLTASGVTIDSSNNISGANNVQKGNDTLTVGLAGSGADYVVSGNANDEINEALDDCSNDDDCGRVYQLPGTYDWNDVVQLQSGVIWEGAGIDKTINKAIASYDPATDCPTASTARCMVIAGVNPLTNVTVRGMTFDGNGPNASAGLSMSNAPHRLVDVRNAENFHWEKNKVLNAINWSVFISNSEYVFIEDSQAFGGWSSTYDQNDGFHVRSSQHVIMRNNYCDTANGGGTGGDDCYVIGSAVAESDRDMAFASLDNNIAASGTRGVLVFTEGDYDTRDISINGTIVEESEHTGILLQKIGSSGDGMLLNINVSGGTITNFGSGGSLPGDGVGIESTVSPPRDFYRNITINGVTIKGGGITGAASAVGAQGKGSGLTITNVTAQDLVGTRCIQVGTASAPNTDAVIGGNKCYLGGGVTNDTLGIFGYGLTRASIFGNELFGNTAGTSNCIYIAAAATAGNDAGGTPRAEPSQHNNISDNLCHNWDNGIVEANAGAAPDNNQIQGNKFSSVTTMVTAVGSSTRVQNASGLNLGLGLGAPTRQFHVFGDAQDTSAVTNAGETGATIYLQDNDNNVGSGGTVVLGATNGLFGAIKGLLTSGSNNTRGHIAFSTRLVDSDAALTEVMRVTDNGLVAIGTGANSITPAGRLHLTETTLGNEVFRIESVATNNDPRESVYQNRAATTDATVTTLHTYTVPASTTALVTCNIAARRTGGSSGTAEDAAGYALTGTFKNAAGTATVVGALHTVVQEDQAAWDATLDVTGATVRARVTGAANNNVTWHSTCRVWQVGS